MFITDGQGNVLRLNKAYEQITGIKADEIIGKNMKKLVEENYYDQSVTLLVMRDKKKHNNKPSGKRRPENSGDRKSGV